MAMQKQIGWGVIATGGISKVFSEGLAAAGDARRVAVGSRTEEKAVDFARQYGFERSYGSYEQLAADPEVDVVYIGTPHTLHCENTLMCLEAGKSVLVEKPFAMNAQEARQMVEKAREKGLYLMEAMWTRFLPVTDKVLEWLGGGAIGKANLFLGSFGISAMHLPPESRIRAPELGGGALLDLGVYPVSYSSLVFGSQPEEIACLAYLKDGIDQRSGMVFQYAGGQTAVLNCAIDSRTSLQAEVCGPDGRILIHGPLYCPTRAELWRGDQCAEKVDVPFTQGNGYTFEAKAVMEDLRAGRTENQMMPLDESVAIVETLDRVRQQWGLRYPME